jgi:outer membrane protein assembly factor BamB/formylglycine-generating enzyme required for sulfatase activity
MSWKLGKAVACVVLTGILTIGSAVGAEPGLDAQMQVKYKEWAQKRVWQPELPKAGGATRAVTCRVVSYGGKWSRHGFGGHGGGGCMFRYSSTDAYNPLPGVERNDRRAKMFSPIPYDVDGDGQKDDFVAALKFSLDEPLGILDWPRGSVFPGRYSARFYGGNAWHVTDAKLEKTRFFQEIGINCDHSGKWLDTRAEDHPLNGAANEKIASSGLRYYFVPIWKKVDFLNGGDRYKVTFDENSFFGSLAMRIYWIGFDDVRYVVQDGDQFYIADNKDYYTPGKPWGKPGEESGGGSIFPCRPTETTWAKYDPKGYMLQFDPKGAQFAKREFKDVQAVGWYLAKNKLEGKLAHCKWYGAEFKATVSQPVSLNSVNVDMKTVPAGNGVQELAMSSCEVPYMLWKRIWEWGDACHYTLDQRYVYRETGDMGSMRFLPAEALAKEGGKKSHGQDEPVTGLNWYDTLAWCNTLSELEGKTPCYYTDAEFTKVFRNAHQATWYQGRINPTEVVKPEPTIYVKWAADGHRLPTPAEWKQAAKADAATTGEATVAVGAGKANANGMYDMHGNVWELVWTHGDTYDPKTNLDIVALGGSFHGDDKPETFSASPYGDVPFNGHHAVGFRLARRNAGLGKPEQGDLNDVAAWTIKRDERLAAAQQPDPVGPGVMETVAISAGSYMKSRKGPEVKISAMHMGKYEVTFAQWEKVRQWAEANGYEFDTHGDMGSMFFHSYEHSPDEPVVRIRWNDMVVWCNALSEMEGRTPVYYNDEACTNVYRKTFGLRPGKTDGWDMVRAGGSTGLDGAPLSYAQKLFYVRWDTDGYRLPTFAERTYVAGRTRGDGWLMLNSAGRTHPVGQKKPNALGLHDLTGNVHEWLWDLSGLKGHTSRSKLNNDNPKNGMFWLWTDGKSEEYSSAKWQSVIGHALKYAGTGWSTAQGMGGSWLGGSLDGYSYRLQMHYADLGFRVVRCDAGTHPRDGMYPWDKIPVMLDTTDMVFDENAGKVWRGGNSRSGVYPSAGIRKLKGVKWTYETGGKVAGSPLVVDGKMYIGTVKGVLCINAEDGGVIWEYPITGGSDSSACLYDGVVYIGGNDSKLHAITAETGKVVWTSRATGPLKSSPCVAYGVVFCGFGTGVSVKDGKPVWGADQKLGPINQTGDGRLTSPAVSKDYLAMSGSHVPLRTAMGGSSGWEGQNTFPLVDGLIYAINSGMGGNMKTPDLQVRKQAGKPIWTGKFQGPSRQRYIAISPPAIWTDFVFVASDFGKIVAFDRRKGKQKWEHMFKPGLAIRSGVSVSLDGLVYLGTHDQHVYCIDGKTGEVLWKYKTGAPIFSSACIADGAVYIGSDDGKIYAFEGEDVKKKLTTEPQARAIRVLMPPDSPRAALIESIGLKTEFVPTLEDILKSPAGTRAIVDASPKNLAALSKQADVVARFTDAGSWLMLWGLTPDGLADFNGVTGMDHLIRPFRHEWVEMVDAPLLAGLHNIDLWFRDPRDVAGQAAGGYMTRNDVFTYVVDLHDIAPFCKLPAPKYWGKDADGPGTDHWPPNLVNGRDYQWQQGFSILLDEKQPTKWTMTLPREQFVNSFSITPDTKYHRITKIKLDFGDGKAPMELAIKPEQTRQRFPFPGRKTKALTIEIAAWDAVGRANVVGVMNVWIAQMRDRKFGLRAQPLLSTGVLVRYPNGKGGILLNQLNVPQKERDELATTKKQAILRTLLVNLGKSVSSL